MMMMMMMMMMMTMMMITMMSIGRWKDKRFQNSSPTNNDDRTERWKDNAERSRKSNCMASGCKEEILIDFVDFVQKNWWLPCLVDNVLSMSMGMSMAWVRLGWVGSVFQAPSAGQGGCPIERSLNQRPRQRMEPDSKKQGAKGGRGSGFRRLSCQSIPLTHFDSNYISF